MSKKYIITKAEEAIVIEPLNLSSKPENLKYEISGTDDMQVSDGYHTMDELYEHRITLFVALCQVVAAGGYFKNPNVWRSKRHSDGELCFGTGTQYVLGINTESSKQITYHVPIERWDETEFATELDKAPEWDGHTSDDVLKRLKNL